MLCSFSQGFGQHVLIIKRDFRWRGDTGFVKFVKRFILVNWIESPKDLTIIDAVKVFDGSYDGL